MFTMNTFSVSHTFLFHLNVLKRSTNVFTPLSETHIGRLVIIIHAYLGQSTEGTTTIVTGVKGLIPRWVFFYPLQSKEARWSHRSFQSVIGLNEAVKPTTYGLW